MQFASSIQNSLCGILCIVFASVALLVGLIGVFTCDAVEFPQTSGDGALSVGLFGYRTKTYITTTSSEGTTIWTSDTCVQYDWMTENGFNFTTDKMTDSLKGLAISLAVIGGVFTILSCIVPCVPKLDPRAWKGLGLIFLLCCILQGCSLLLLQSSICLDNPVIQYLEENHPGVFETLQNPEECEIGTGYNMSISAVVFWFLAGMIPLVVPIPFGCEDEASPPAPVADMEAKDDVEAKRVEETEKEQEQV